MPVAGLVAGVVAMVTAVGTDARPDSTPTVTADAKVAEAREMARTPASHRPDTEREEDAGAVVVDGSPTRIAGVAAAGEDGATGTASTDTVVGVNGSAAAYRPDYAATAMTAGEQHVPAVRGNTRLPSISRRRFLGGTVAASASAVLTAACGPGPQPSPSPTTTATPAPTPSPTLPPPTSYFDALAELRDAVRGSPDHLAEEAARLVAAGDAAQITTFVRDRIATYPASFAATGAVESGRRWGTRATLRGGAGTPREKADLLAELLTRAGTTADVVEVEIAEIAAANLFRPATVAPAFRMAIDDARFDALRPALGLPPSVEIAPPLDPAGADSTALADGLLARFTEPPKVVDPFEARSVRTLPMVRIGGADNGAQLADPIGDRGLAPVGDTRVTAVPDPGDLVEVTVTVEAARGDAPNRPFTLVEGRWSADDLVGRRLHVSFPPPAESLEELILIRPRDVTVVTPSLVIRGQDLDAAATQALAVLGAPITLGGDVIDVEAADGIVRVGDAPVGPLVPDPARVAAIASLAVVPLTAGFPTMSLGVRALDAAGAPVEGLPATAFRILDEDIPVGSVLERSEAPAPRILVLLDDSSSIPDPFRGVGAARLARDLASRLAAVDPATSFRIAKVSLSAADPGGGWTTDLDALEAQATSTAGYGSELWAALADAAKLGATAIVFITDGLATDLSGVTLTAPPPDLAAQVRIGPRTVIIGVGETDAAGLAALGEAGRLGAFTVDDQAVAIAAIVRALAEDPEPSYRFRYHAPAESPTTRTVRLELLGTAIAGTGTYEVPPPDERARPAGLSGLFLTVKVGTTEARRVLAGVDAPSPDSAITRLDVERVRRALFDSTVLEFEGAAPPAAVILDETYTAILALRPLAEATDRATRLAALAGLGAGGPTLEPATLHALSVPLPELAGTPLTYEAGLRVTLHREQAIPDGLGRAVHRRSVDLLPSARFTTVETDPVTAFAATARRTARLAIAEAAGFPTSTMAALEGEALVPVGFSIFDLLDPIDRDLARAMDAAVEPWRSVQPKLLIPADGTPTAAWAFDGRTGSLVGLLADGSGGGSEEADIEDTFDAAESLLDGAGLVSDIASAAGLGGFSFVGGVWIQLEKTKLQKLKAATLMLASMRPPAGDITDLSDLGCGLGAAAGFEAAGRIGGRMMGEEGERDDAGG